MKLPRYQQVTNDILNRIRQGEWPTGTKIPKDEDLEDWYKTSRITILRALQELQQLGFLRRVRGHGTYVNEVGPPATVAEKVDAPSVRFIAVVFPQRESYGAHEILMGIENIFSTHEYIVAIKNTRDSHTNERMIMESLLMLKPAGVILFPTNESQYNTDLISRFVAEKIPLVLIDRKIAYLDIPFVACDNKAGAMTVVGHLLSRGKKRIAFVGNSLEHLSSEQERFSGYCQALAESGVSVNMELVKLVGLRSKDYDPAKIDTLVVELRDLKIDAVFAVNDLLAITLTRHLRQQGILVPQQIAVAGFDDIDFAMHFRPALTTYHQPFMKIGKEAAQVLLAAILGTGSPENQEIKVPGTLIVRDSA